MKDLQIPLFSLLPVATETTENLTWETPLATPDPTIDLYIDNASPEFRNAQFAQLVPWKLNRYLLVDTDVTEPFAVFDIFYDANTYFDATETEAERPHFEVTRIYQFEVTPEYEREPHRDDFRILFIEKNVPRPRFLDLTYDNAFKTLS